MKPNASFANNPFYIKQAKLFLTLEKKFMFLATRKGYLKHLPERPNLSKIDRKERRETKMSVKGSNILNYCCFLYILWMY